MAKNFGAWLAREIENRLLTRAQFAELAGFSRPALIRWLSQARPSLRGTNIVRIANALEIPREEVEAHLGLHAAAA